MYVISLNICIFIHTLPQNLHFSLLGCRNALQSSGECKFQRMAVVQFTYHFGKYALGRFVFKCKLDQMFPASLADKPRFDLFCHPNIGSWLMILIITCKFVLYHNVCETGLCVEESFCLRIIGTQPQLNNCFMFLILLLTLSYLLC